MKKNRLYGVLVLMLIIATTLLVIMCKSNIIPTKTQKIIDDNNTQPLPNSAASFISNNITYEYNMNYDETSDNNIRYNDSNPNNYVLFNNERWRIIGVFNNIETSDNNKKTLIKIMRSESIGKYTWDSSTNDVNSVYSGLGVNNWSTSDLMFLLNYGNYWNSSKGQCYVDKNNKTEPCDFTSIGLSENSKELIEKVKWNIASSNTSTLKAGSMYKKEHSNNTWTGYVGLISPSDYGYASSKCANNTALNNYDIEACNYTNYIYKTITNDVTEDLWTIMSDYKVNSKVYTVGKVMNKANTYDSRNVYPVVYLKENVKITSGSGSYVDPYILSI